MHCHFEHLPVHVLSTGQRMLCEQCPSPVVLVHLEWLAQRISSNDALKAAILSCYPFHDAQMLV